MAGALVASAALNLPTQNCSYVFNTNMKLGSQGADVKNLQTVLNMFPQTTVATSGVGSTGKETTYFGPATKAAVIKFQDLHLADLGIPAGNGNVFSLTRGLLNQICTGSTGTVSTTLPAGCTSTAGFSPLTGASCASGVVTTTTLPAGCTSTAGFSPTTGASCATGVTSTPITGATGPVSAMLSASQPAGMLAAGQSGALLANITFSGNGTVTNVELQRVGVSIDASLVNVYLYDGNTRISDAASVVTGGFIRFNSSTGLFAVNGSRNISVRADICNTTVCGASIVGQAIGVKLNSVTALGGTATTYTNVMGPVMAVSGVTLATANLSAMSTSTRTVDAGTNNYAVWSDAISIGTRDVNLKAATFKFVGSAPADALSNVSLFIDGVKVAGPSMVDANNNNKVTFDLGATPFLLKTGSHTLEVRGDVIKGSNRTMTFSLENVADLMLEDSNLAGVNLSATMNNGTLTNGNSAYGQITVNQGTVTVNLDPAFIATKVTGGSTNMPIGQFTLKAYGEDVKVQSLQVAFATSSALTFSGATTASTSLTNVGLFLNGGQIGTNQNYSGSALSFTLGSSLVIPAGQTVTLTVKADLKTTDGYNLTGGSIYTTIGGVSNNAQGMSSNEMTSVASAGNNGQTLTVSTAAGTFARTSGFSAVTVAPNTQGVKIGSFTLQANSAENLNVTSFGVRPVVATYAGTNLSNLTLKSGSTVLGTPVGNPVENATSSFSFAQITIPANQTMTFDVYADIGGATSGSVTAAAEVNYRGAVSNNSTISSATGIAITSANSTLNAATLSAASPVAQFVTGGSTFGIATFKLSTASAGTVANVRELRFSASASDAIESITVGGVTSPFVSGTSTVSGLNIALSSTGTDVPVTVKFAGYQNTATGGSLSTTKGNVKITLSYVEAISGSNTITNGTLVDSNTMIDVASKPSVSVSAGNVDTLILGVNNKIGEFTVTADANGKIALATTSITAVAVGIDGYQISAPYLADGTTQISTASVSGSSTMVVTFSPAYEIAAGTSKTFSLYATVAGANTASVSQHYIATKLTSGLTFNWQDTIGGATAETGLTLLNFPTNSYTTVR